MFVVCKDDLKYCSSRNFLYKREVNRLHFIHKNSSTAVVIPLSNSVANRYIPYVYIYYTSLKHLNPFNAIYIFNQPGIPDKYLMIK